MRVALDARTMQDRPVGGIGRTLVNIAPRLAAEVELVLLTDARQPPVAGTLPEHALRAPSGHGVAWLQIAAPRWLRGFDGLFHCPFYGLPFRLRVPGVATIHDLTFEHHPEWFPKHKITPFRTQARHAARVAGAVLTVSEHVRDDLCATYHIDPERIVVAPNAVDPVFAPGRADIEVTRRLGVTRPYLVTLAGNPRRNHGLAIAAWSSLRNAGHELDLVVVGPCAEPPRPGLVQPGPLSDDAWAAVLAGAEAFVYPTLYEGFGMPALEACASGTPVVALAVGALPEVLGDAGWWCAAPTVESFADATSRVLAADRAATRASSVARAAGAPGWADCATAHLRAYHLALDA